MEKLFADIQEKIAAFQKDAEQQVSKGNKAAGMRARKAALELMKLLKEFRKESVAATKWFHSQLAGRNSVVSFFVLKIRIVGFVSG